jgi:hypothetical protein
MAPSCTSISMLEHQQRSARDNQRIREWQFLLLRFAITRDAIDRAAAASVAQPLDAAPIQAAPSFSYFMRTTSEICNAIARTRDADTRSTLQRFVARIDDERLRAAFVACLELEDRSVPPPRSRAAWRERHDIWRGLPKR